jgi:hypothetical protein
MEPCAYDAMKKYAMVKDECPEYAWRTSCRASSSCCSLDLADSEPFIFQKPDRYIICVSIMSSVWCKCHTNTSQTR